MRRTYTGTMRRNARLCTALALTALLVPIACTGLFAQQNTPPPSLRQQLNRTLDSLRAARPATAADSAMRDRLVSMLAALPADSSKQLQLDLVRPARGPIRGVFKGHTVVLDLNRPPAGDTPIVVMVPVDSLGRNMGSGVLLPVYAVKDTNLYVSIPDTVKSGRYEVVLYTGNAGTRTRIEYAQPLVVESIWYAIGMSALPLAALILLIVAVGSQKRTALNPSVPGTQAKESIIRMFLVDPRNNCLSLSRLQFLIWTVIIAFSYCFLFCARVIAENVWTFPPLDGFATTFFISLGTLLGSEATTQVKGAMGANAVKPKLSDLFMHGGVVAPERVQQILWTIISSTIFVLTVVNNYAISTTIPEIPSELLVLMGISSAGYLTGKMIRKPGPVVTSVVPDANTITLEGENIARDAKVFVDGKQLKQMDAEPDPDKPEDMVQSATFSLPADPKVHEALAKGTASVWVVNRDGQRAQWQMPRPGTASAGAGGSTNASTDTNAGGAGSNAGDATTGGGAGDAAPDADTTPPPAQ